MGNILKKLTRAYYDFKFRNIADFPYTVKLNIYTSDIIIASFFNAKSANVILISIIDTVYDIIVRYIKN